MAFVLTFFCFSFMLSAWKESHRRESDSWPLPYQGSALPLSYCGLFLLPSHFSSTFVLFFEAGLGSCFVPLFSSGRRGSNPPPIAWKAIALPNELLPLLFTFGISWGRVDSNHRTLPRTDLQSVAIAAMRLPRYCWPIAQFSECRTSSRWRDSNPRQADYKSATLPTELHRLLSTFQTTLFLYDWGCKNTTFFKYCKRFFQFFLIIIYNTLIIFTIKVNIFSLQPAFPFAKRLLPHPFVLKIVPSSSQNSPKTPQNKITHCISNINTKKPLLLRAVFLSN